MRRVHLVLLAASRLCSARSHQFSIHEDLLAFPQFDVVFDDGYISEREANEFIDKTNGAHSTYAADFSQSTPDNVRGANDDDEQRREDDQSSPSHTYEIMNMARHRYLCSIPVIQPAAAENQTASDLAEAEAARELVRATASGWDLLAQLETSCLYFMSGWWSYSFCNNREIVQFHALPSIPNGKPPQRDPLTAEYTLGRTPTIPANAAYQAKQNGQDPPPPAELQVKGDQRYLVQKLEGGTICDLTGRERTIEVQYHCVPELKADRIGWIEEVTICAYLMVINTPRLCSDVAFLPPGQTAANPISCKLIVDENSPQLLLDQEKQPPADPMAQEQTVNEAEAAQSDLTAGQKEAPKIINVGGVVVGARNVLSGADEEGKPPVKLPPPRSYFSNTDADYERFIEVVAKGASSADGGETTVLTDKQMKDLELDPKSVKDMIEKVRKLAKEKGWKLEMVELPGDNARELRAYIDQEEGDAQGEAAPEKAEKEEAQVQGGAQDEGKADQEPNEQAKVDEGNEGTQPEEGSQEDFYKKDEL